MKTSKYLEDKCQSLNDVIDFFISGNLEQRIIFLSQIDFWDWEIENLIFSFTNFENRSKAWSGNDIFTMLEKNGINLKDSAWNEIKYQRQWEDEIKQWKHSEDVVAPVKMLNKVIVKWNMLMQNIKNKLVIDENFAEKFGITGNHISKYIKKEK